MQWKRQHSVDFDLVTVQWLDRLVPRDKEASLQRAALRERGCMPIETFALNFKYVARPNLCETPALAKPPPHQV